MVKADKYKAVVGVENLKLPNYCRFDTRADRLSAPLRVIGSVNTLWLKVNRTKDERITIEYPDDWISARMFKNRIVTQQSCTSSGTFRRIHYLLIRFG